MANPTTNYGWQMPTSTDLVTDLPADFEVFGQAVDTSLLGLKGGTTGQVLSKTSGTDMAFTWSTDASGIPATIVDAKGDIIAGTAADAVSRLEVGANNTILTADSTTGTGLKWAAPAASGGMTLLSTTAITAAATISITGIDQTYNELIIVVENAATSGTGIAVDMQFNSNSTSGEYVFVLTKMNAFYGGGTCSSIPVFNNATATANTNSMRAVVRITRYTDTTRKAINLYSACIGLSNSGAQSLQNNWGSFLGSAAISSVQFITDSGTWSAQGNIYIYGVK